jgi:hypothetical protein
MKPDKTKDALTDLVGVAGNQDSSGSNPNVGEGQAVTSSGEVVTLGIDAEMQRDIDVLSKTIVKQIKNKREK